MVLSESYKFVALSNPKCFSTSVRKALAAYGQAVISEGDFGLHPHMTAGEVKTLFNERNWVWDDWYKFTFARNPFELLRSHYAYGKYDGERYFWTKGWNPDTLVSFEEWFWKGNVFDRRTMKMTPEKAILSVQYFSEGIIDKIYWEGSFDEFERDLSQRVKAQVKLGRENASEPVNVFYSDDMIRQVHRDFAWEFENFGYPDRP